MEHEERLKAALAHRYAIEREIGSGGMATVYLATDIRHERKVALKVLRPDLAASLGAERFLQEVRVTANLTHPHILPLHDSGEADGFLFYVMPFIEGESLRDRLVREHELPVTEAARILRDVVDALAAAHRLGVVHRDIKPENVLISGRHAMVADFGVAKAVSEATGRHKLTTLGVALGTPSYMAPEQAAADEAIDHRADIYAVGAMAYELLTGRPPFTAGTPQQVLAAQVMEAPLPVTELRASVPPALETLIMQCLEKKPADRWQSAEEMLPHLEAAVTPSGGITPTDMQPVTLPTPGAGRRWLPWGAGFGIAAALAAAYFLFFFEDFRTSPPVEEQRVAVLPLENLTGDASLDGLGLQASNWISDGLAVLTDLLVVVPFSDVMLSSRALSGSGSPAAALVRTWPEETGATTAVVGSYALLGDSLEFRLRVVAADGTVLTPIEPLMGTRSNTSETLGRLQTRVMGAVVGVVAPGHEMAEVATGLTPPHPDALQEYLEAMYRVGSNNQGALENLERAVAIDPDYLNAYLMMVPTLSNLGRREEQDSVCQLIATRSGELVSEQRLWYELECSDDRVVEMNAARRLARNSPGYLYRAALHGVQANRPRAVIGFCREWNPDLSRMTRGWSGAMWNHCLRAFHMVEDYEGELAFIEKWKRWSTSNPDRWQSREAYALFGLGRYDEGVELIEERLSDLTATSDRVDLLDDAAQEADAHGHPDEAIEYWERALDLFSTLSQADLESRGARRGRVEILLYLGQPEEAVEILLGLVEENPDREDDLGRLGIARAKLGERSEAERISEALVLMARPFERGDPTYWRACIAAELGDREEAVRLLSQAIEEQWNVGLRPHRSQYLKPLRGYEPFERLVEPKG